MFARVSDCIRGPLATLTTFGFNVDKNSLARLTAILQPGFGSFAQHLHFALVLVQSSCVTKATAIVRSDEN